MDKRITNPRELEDKIVNYFEHFPEYPTISGLARYLGYKSRNSLDNLARKNDEIGYLLSIAILQIEEIHERGLNNPHCSGNIFFLKCRGWDGESQIDDDEDVIAQEDLSILTTQELEEYLRLTKKIKSGV